MTTLPPRSDSVLRDGTRVSSKLALLFLVVTRFASMTDREQHDLLPIEPIQDNIGAMAEGYDPFPELGRHIRCRASNLRMSGKFADPCADHTRSTLGCVGT